MRQMDPCDWFCDPESHICTQGGFLDHCRWAYRLKQWLAVITHRRSRMAPPQAGISEYCRETCHGHECAHASCPPIIRLSSSSFSGINARTPAWSGKQCEESYLQATRWRTHYYELNLTITSIAKDAVCLSWSVHIRILFSILKINITLYIVGNRMSKPSYSHFG